MEKYQQQFIELCLQHQILRFGEFTLKSGRLSPYFFNAGLFNTGTKLAKLGEYYGHAIQHAKIEFDMLFGPAYKGIPLVTATAIALHHTYQRDIPLCFNRKEAKDHGEGGQLIGSPLQGKVLILDDVITAGTAFREAEQLIHQHQARITGVVLALDRQEKGESEHSAVQEIQQRYNIPVISIIKFADLVAYLEQKNAYADFITKIHDYRTRYGCKTE